MRTLALLFAIMAPMALRAGERVSVRGRIVDESGNAVEYVHVGIPKLGIGTVSTQDGRFSIEVPADTLEFHHVSYQTACYPVTGPDEEIVITLHEEELPPAVFISGKCKEKSLIKQGIKIPSAAGDYYRPNGTSVGTELGSVANVKKPFMIKKISFPITANFIPGCVAAINVYRIDGKESFANILHKPIYVNVALSESIHVYDVEPDETILLEPGRYFISFQVVGCDEDAVKTYLATPESERNRYAMHMYTHIYYKSSYFRKAALATLRHIPVNIGVSVSGLEFQ